MLLLSDTHIEPYLYLKARAKFSLLNCNSVSNGFGSSGGSGKGVCTGGMTNRLDKTCVGFGTGESVCSADRSGFYGSKAPPPLHPRSGRYDTYKQRKSSRFTKCSQNSRTGCGTPLFREQCCNADFAFLSSVSLFDLDLYVFFLFNHIRPELMLFVPAAFDALSQCPFSHQPITAVLSRILVPKGSSLVGRSPCQIIVRNTALSTGLCCAKAVTGANAVRHSEILRIIRVFVCNRLQLRLGSQKKTAFRQSFRRTEFSQMTPIAIRIMVNASETETPGLPSTSAS